MTKFYIMKFAFLFKSITIGILFLTRNIVFVNQTNAQCTTPPNESSYICSGGNGVITNNANVNSGQTYWYTSTGTVSGVNMGGGTLIVCGNLTLSGGDNNGGTIIVKPGATLTISMSSLNGIIDNFGTLNINSSLSMNSNAMILNASTGTINMNGGNYTLTCNGQFVNYGTANIYSVFASNSSNRICMGTNSVINATNISSNTSNGWNAPSGAACVSYSGIANINNGNFTSTSNVKVCKKTGATKTGNGSWGSAVVTDQCSSCGSAITVSVTASPNTICNGNSTTLTATGSGGTSPFSYAWSNGSLSGANPTTPALTSTTTYTVTITDNVSATATGSVIVTVNAVPTANAGNDAIICNGTTTSLTATGGSTFLWNTNATTAIISVSPTITSTYTVTVTSNNCTSTDNAVVTVNTSPTANAGNDVSITNGASTTLSATGGINYTWNIFANTQMITVSPTLTSTYTVTASDVNGCTSSDNVVVVVLTGCKQPPSEEDFICNGGNGVITNGANINSGQTYWYNQNGTLNNFNVNGGTAIICGNLTVNSINYNGGKLIIKSGATLTVTSYSNINCNVYNYGTININNGAIIHSPVEFINSNCAILNMNSGNDQLAVDGEFANYGTANLYSIKTQGSTNRVCLGAHGILNATNIETWSANTYYATEGGTACLHYTGIANLNNGAFTSTSAINICKATGATKTGSGTWGSATINEGCSSCISNPVSAGSDVSICIGDSVNLVATGGSMYVWSTTETTASINVSPTQTTSYVVSLSNQYGCSATDEVIVTVNNLPTANAGSDIAICTGDSINLTATGGTTYQWNTSDITESINISPILTTTYTVTVASNNCTSTDNVVVTVNAIPTANAGEYVRICSGDTVDLTATGGTSYIWNTNDTTASISVSPITTINTYTVTITTNNCTASDALIVFVNTQPTANLGNDVAICTGDSTNLTALGLGTTYLWSTSDTTVSINVSPSSTTTYTVLIANNTCTSTDEVIVTVNPLPIINRDSLLTQYISGKILAIGGTPPYTYAWSAPLLTDFMDIFTTSNNTISLTVTDANLCSARDSVTINPNINPNLQSCSELFISEYIQDTSHYNNAIELYNPTDTIMDLSNYYIMQTTNGSIFSSSIMIKLTGTIDAYKTFVIANSFADSTLISKANMLSDSFIFNGKDIVALTYISAGTSNLQMIDKIGDIMTEYTDSGWVAGLGSTKNHNLIRQPNVVKGNSNWLSCKNEWNIFPQGMYDSLGKYINVCTPIDPYLVLSIAEKENGKSCYPNSYYEFNVMASCSDYATLISSCKVKIKYTSGGALGDKISGVIVTNGKPFSGFSKYVSYQTSSSGNSFTITFGNKSNLPTYNEKYINGESQVLFTVKIPIVSCKGTTILTIVPDPSYSYFKALGDVNHYDSIPVNDPYMERVPIPGKFDCLPENCPTYDCPYVQCYENKMVDHWKTYLIPVYNYTYLKYSDDIASGSLSVAPCQFKIESHTDSVYPGTNFGDDVLIIKGSGFGDKGQTGKVKVHDANGSDDYFALNSKDYIYWKENEIKIKMPSVMAAPLNEYVPGSGNFILSTDCGDADIKPLTILYSIKNKAKYTINSSSDTTYYKERYNIVKANDSTRSLVFRCDTSIFHNSQAYACVKKAIDLWNCNTGVNWTLGDTVALSTGRRDSLSNAHLINDGISYIYFTDNFPSSDTKTLMSTLVDPGLPCNDLVNAFMNKANIKIRRDLSNVNGSPIWNYDTIVAQIESDNAYFYDALLHELGHAHLLNHVNKPDDLMYYKVSNSTRITTISPQDYFGAFTVIDLSKDVTGCSPYQPLESGNHDCNVSVPFIEKKVDNFNVFPNPVGNENFTISYLLTKNTEVQFLIMDYTGKNLLTLNKGKKVAGKYTEQVNISQFSKGVYLIIANINGVHQTIKLIKQ